MMPTILYGPYNLARWMAKAIYNFKKNVKINLNEILKRKIIQRNLLFYNKNVMLRYGFQHLT